MLLLHQIGSVKIGEVVRYTVTYTPSHDRILPSPESLHLRIRNTSPLPLRAAFVHGPYTLSVSAYPAHFDPNKKFENPRRYGVPEFEPMLKAAGTWSCQLIVPDNIRESAGTAAKHDDFASGVAGKSTDVSASWVIEVASQVIFSSSASVGFELLLARDEKSLSLGSTPVVKGQAHLHLPGKVSDFQQNSSAKVAHQVHPRGVFSRAVHLKVEDTASLWNTPKLPGWNECDNKGAETSDDSSAGQEGEQKDAQRPKKVHLVILTHGLHSNLGADMLYLKESIDATARQARVDAKIRKAREKKGKDAADAEQQTQQPIEGEDEDEDDSSEEQVIVRGFAGNATRTERGIKFLGKRLARYILLMTYPDQPFLPATKKAVGNIAHTLKDEISQGTPIGRHKQGPMHAKHSEKERKFQITSISLIGHSLGGLVQTYAVAYIQKHSPQFFELIKPINFIALASPFLGLSNENPLYVKFALDFGLVGRTGQDVGLTWRAPTIARSGWGAIVGTLGESAHKKVMGDTQPESKPLLRILPTGPAHTALKKFRNRTVYSNVVNDGIVPLRTSCLLFLDWQGLDRVEKARREAGLVETVVGFGWAELTGTSMTARKTPWNPDAEEEVSSPPAASSVSETPPENFHEVPQPPSNATVDDDRQSLNLVMGPQHSQAPPAQHSQTNNDSPFSGLFNFFKGSDHSKTPRPKSPTSWSHREIRIYKRSQTLNDSGSDSTSPSRSKVTTGQEFEGDESIEMSAPPRTTFFESAGDLLNPKQPSVEFLLDPSKRPRTIFHDRVYRPSDIPPPPLKRRGTGTLTMRRRSTSHGLLKNETSGESSAQEGQKADVKHQDSSFSTRDYDDRVHTDPERQPDEVIDSSSMRVEEKIARAYHRDLSWRKVLVNLEPDAHNNIIVRRTFANAHGWPVVKHLVDAHFSDAALSAPVEETGSKVKRARAASKKQSETITPSASGEIKPVDAAESPTPDAGNLLSVATDRLPRPSMHARSASEIREATDSVPDLPTPQDNSTQTSHSFRESPSRSQLSTADSATWSDHDFADSADESEFDMDLAYGQHLTNMPQTPPPGDSSSSSAKAKRQSSSPTWNWTEKIVGKGATRRMKERGSQSPVESRTRNGSPDAGAGL